eukprot:NODE_2857_length_1325_cov_88.194676_g2713_i0.p1 GENE.NODE_2857_length_1325_cov_88.194676_g2713_i0~~NODE_2857_length_1325_cov_88.194676_g2713_i0.p1  ORF type:complete len:373 (+),score=56.68 NODE_2857_length_1325_cov_88.194676_g2713_i0:77-1195(+)
MPRHSATLNKVGPLGDLSTSSLASARPSSRPQSGVGSQRGHSATSIRPSPILPQSRRPSTASPQKASRGAVDQPAASPDARLPDLTGDITAADRRRPATATLYRPRSRSPNARPATAPPRRHRPTPREEQRMKAKAWLENRKNRRLATVVTAVDTVSLPIEEAEYLAVVKEWERLDPMATGELGLAELIELGETVGIKVDMAVFKKMDRDRSGTVDFMELLKILWSHVTARDRSRATKQWGKPHPNKAAMADLEAREWQQRYDQSSLEELTAIFKIFATGTAKREPHSMHKKAAAQPQKQAQGPMPSGITRQALRQAIPSSSLDDNIIDELFELHDSDHNNELSLEEFATIMEDTYLLPSNRQAEVKLYFQT